MKQARIRSTWLSMLALLFALPAAYFIFSNLLNEIGVKGPYEAIEPVLRNTGDNATLRWGTNLLILVGPVLAILLTVFQVMRISFWKQGNDYNLEFSVQKKWFPILVTAVSLGLLAFLFGYLAVENCNC